MAEAERILDQDGLDALTLRRLAEQTDLTTRAVYSLFGNKDGLLLALSERAFGLLGSMLAAVPQGPNPATDIVDAGLLVFRQFALEHPALFRLAIQHTIRGPELDPQARAVQENTWSQLLARFTKLAEAGRLGPRDVQTATLEFHALCEGLAALELRGTFSDGRSSEIWRDALSALITGFSTIPIGDPMSDHGRRGSSKQHQVSPKYPDW